MSVSVLVKLTPRGLQCPPGDFYIDPWEPVDCAVLTHAHSDHARTGSRVYHAVRDSQPILEHRLGDEAHFIWHEYGERFALGPVTVSLHPAGHILGSAQVRIEYEGTVWVVTGDYKTQPDPTCRPFEVVPCDGLVTEATFGLPIYDWPDTDEVAAEVYAWWQKNRALGRNSLLGCYALGKAQRLLAALGKISDEPIYTHTATENIVQMYRDLGVTLPPTLRVQEAPKKLSGALILAPPSSLGSPWARRFGDAATGFASGWMQIRGNRRRRGYDKGFVLSDHADWKGLLSTIENTRARKVLVTHGYSEELARYLAGQGLDAEPLATHFQGEGDA
ncbi:MAG TPA: ligase-associated DNA damage response exonuclease [Oligoflexus sp.]|uniref:ligase-associated DNA damage response exonuclease n=1 Tax=Oligoflexus sp. TaxID=1971216 RepID=UPI002D7EE33A|nr:ligase-associated DNA damage response exonuclease [Oligoflexus sp.]HET9238376.1 ligase-associated DNA damage response exonuclease [Oligoflexus sp.]